MPIQIRRTDIPNNPPSDLAEGQLAVELANDPPTFWVGVPQSINPNKRAQFGVGGGGGGGGIIFESGTVTLFYNASAPVGWTKVTTHNDVTLRVVNGEGGGSGGTVNFSSVFASGRATNNTTIAIATMPSHAHGGTWPAAWAGTVNGVSCWVNNGSDPVTGGGHTGGSGHNHPIAMALMYFDVILARKD